MLFKWATKQISILEIIIQSFDYNAYENKHLNNVMGYSVTGYSDVPRPNALVLGRVARWDTRSWGERVVLGLSHLLSDHRICIGWSGNARPKYAEIIAFLLDSWFTFCIFYYILKNTVTRRLVLTLLLYNLLMRPSSTVVRL